MFYNSAPKKNFFHDPILAIEDDSVVNSNFWEGYGSVQSETDTASEIDSDYNDESCYEVSSISSKSSDESVPIVPTKTVNQFQCKICKRRFISKYHLLQHVGSKSCIRNKHANKTTNARDIRMLKNKIENNKLNVQIIGGDVHGLIPDTYDNNTYSFSTGFFKRGWARRPRHGYSKGKIYMTDAHKEQIENFEGEEDKGMKMSADSMLESMRKFHEDTHTIGNLHPKHYLPFVSKITVVINQLLTKSKKKKKLVNSI